MSDKFPRWLDPRTLQWAADYCELMGIRLADVENVPGSVGADVCARGLRDAQGQAEARSRPLQPVPLLSLLDGAGNVSALCSDCPPVDYTGSTCCQPCPRRPGVGDG